MTRAASGPRRTETERTHGRSPLTGLIVSGRLDQLDPDPFPVRHADWMILGFLS
jgi:hypothetical protein